MSAAGYKNSDQIPVDAALRKQLDSLPWGRGKRQQIEDRGMAKWPGENGRPVEYRIGVLVDTRDKPVDKST